MRCRACVSLFGKLLKLDLSKSPMLFVVLVVIFADACLYAACKQSGASTNRLSIHESVPSQEEQEYGLPPGISYEHLQRTEPRPLHIHVLKIDLEESKGALGMRAEPDPDGDGPAETALASPLSHCKEGRFSVGINANAWSMLPDPKTGKKIGYVVGGASDIVGLAVAESKLVSPADTSWSFWLDGTGEPGMGPGNKAPRDVSLAISGFGKLIQDGQVSGSDKPLHPRTAIGISEDRRVLTLVVIDGRQPGYSEGVSLRELAELMSELGCHDALNLDGGGSSVMILTDKKNQLRVANRPAVLIGLRPIPVFFGVKSPARQE